MRGADAAHNVCRPVFFLPSTQRELVKVSRNLLIRFFANKTTGICSTKPAALYYEAA